MKKFLIPSALLMIIPLCCIIFAILSEWNDSDNTSGMSLWMMLAFVSAPLTIIPFLFKVKWPMESLKRTGFMSGAIVFSFIGSAILFKQNHFAGGDLLVIISMVCFSFIFVPIFAKYLYDK